MAKKKNTAVAKAAAAAAGGAAFGLGERIVNAQLSKNPANKISPELVSGGMLLLAGIAAVMTKENTPMNAAALGALGSSAANVGLDLYDRVQMPEGAQASMMPSRSMPMPISAPIASPTQITNMARGEAAPVSLPHPVSRPAVSVRPTPRPGAIPAIRDIARTAATNNSRSYKNMALVEEANERTDD